MTDLDKLAREMLAAEYDADSPGSMTAERLRSGLPAMWWGDDLALRAIRAALLTAPPGYVQVDRATLLEMRDVAMRWTREGRLPECVAFSRIAQDADAMLAAAPEVGHG